MADCNPSFAALLTQARSGDAQAMATLVDQYESQIRAVAHVRLGSALRPYADTVDVVQSVHRSLLTGLRNDKFEISGPEKLVALAVTILQRKIARHARRAKRRVREGHANFCLQQPATSTAAYSERDMTATQSMQSQELLQHTLESLNDIERRLIELRLEGRSTADAARVLGVSADVMRVRLSRLRKRLRDHPLLRDL